MAEKKNVELVISEVKSPLTYSKIYGDKSRY